MQDVAHLIGVDPLDDAVVHIRDLEEGMCSGVSGSAFAEDHLPHPPGGVIGSRERRLVHDHELTRSHAQEHLWLLLRCRWNCRGWVVCAHRSLHWYGCSIWLGSGWQGVAVVRACRWRGRAASVC